MPVDEKKTRNDTPTILAKTTDFRRDAIDEWINPQTISMSEHYLLLMVVLL